MNHIPETGPLLERVRRVQFHPSIYWLSNLLLQFFKNCCFSNFRLTVSLCRFPWNGFDFFFFYKRMTLSASPKCCKSCMLFLLSRMTWSRSPTFLLGLRYWALGGWYELNGLSPNSLFLRSPSPIFLNPRPPKYVGLNPRPPKYVGKKFMKRFSIMFHWSSSISRMSTNSQ